MAISSKLAIKMNLKIIGPIAEYQRYRPGIYERPFKIVQPTLPYLAALVPKEVEVSITDEQIEEANFQESVDLVAITALTPFAIHSYGLAEEYRKRGTPVVLGGVHPTIMPQEALQHADAVVIGEAEESFPRMINDFLKGELKPIYYPPGRPISLRGLPIPRRELLNRKKYGIFNTLIATRGCPFSCHFCTLHHFYGHGFRARPIPEVIAEIKSLQGKFIMFWDDNLIGDHSYARELFQAMIPLKKWWISQVDSTIVQDDELLKLAAASGCVGLFVGIESVSQESLKSASKNHNQVSQYRTLVKKLKQYGMALHVGIVFGFNTDDPSIFETTVHFLQDIGVASASFKILVPFPSTEVFTQLEREGRILTRDWSKYDGDRYTVFRPKLMSKEELEAGLKWARKEFFSYSSILRRYWETPVNPFLFFVTNLGYRSSTARLNQLMGANNG